MLYHELRMNVVSVDSLRKHLYNVQNKYLVPDLSVLFERLIDDGLIFCRMPKNTRFKGYYTAALEHRWPCDADSRK